MESRGSPVATSRQGELRTLAEQKALAQLALSILRGDDLASVWESALGRLATVLSACPAEVLERDTAGPRLVVRATVGWGETPDASLPVPVRLDRPTWRALLGDGVTVVGGRPSQGDAWGRVLARRRVEGSAYGLVRTSGRVFGVLGVHRDSSRPFTAEDLQFLGAMAQLVGHATESARRALLQAEAQRVARVGHDFNNVLAVIQGYVEILLEEVGDGSPLRGDLDSILRATGRASALVAQLVVLGDHVALEGDRSPWEPPAAVLPFPHGV